MYTVRVKCAPVPRQRVHPILQWRKPGHNPGVCYEYHTEFAHSCKPAYTRPPFCGGSNPSQSAIAMGAYRFISLGIIKCPAGGILLYLAEMKYSLARCIRIGCGETVTARRHFVCLAYLFSNPWVLMTPMSAINLPAIKGG